MGDRNFCGYGKPIRVYVKIKHIAYDEFAEEALKQFKEFDLKHGYPTVADCEDILRNVAEQMKGGAEQI